MNTSQKKWLSAANGKGAVLAVANNGRQCPDVPKDYAQSLWPNIPWATSVGYGHAKDLFKNMPDKYWTKIINNPNNPKQLPPPGSVIVWDGWSANPFGHIAVVEASSKAGIRVLQQDGTYPWKPIHRAYYPYSWQRIIGWLVPKLNEKGKDMKTNKTALNVAYRLYLGRSPDESAERTYLGMDYDKAIASIAKSKELETKAKLAAKGEYDPVSHLPKPLRSVFVRSVSDDFEPVKQTVYVRRKK